MSVSAYLVFVEALLFLTLWLFACAYGTVVSTALASGCGTDLRGAVARIVPLAVATVSTSAVFAAPAFSVLTHSSNTASDVVRGVFLAAWGGLIAHYGWWGVAFLWWPAAFLAAVVAVPA